jgi:hypothetical protein
MSKRRNYDLKGRNRYGFESGDRDDPDMPASVRAALSQLPEGMSMRDIIGVEKLPGNKLRLRFGTRDPDVIADAMRPYRRS